MYAPSSVFTLLRAVYACPAENVPEKSTSTLERDMPAKHAHKRLVLVTVMLSIFECGKAYLDSCALRQPMPVEGVSVCVEQAFGGLVLVQ